MWLEKVVIIMGLLLSSILTDSTLFELGQGIKPDFVILFVVYFALIKGELAGIWLGFLGGVLADGELGKVITESGITTAKIGLHSFAYTLVGYGVGHFIKKVYEHNSLSAFLVILASTFFARLLVMLLYQIFFGEVGSYSLFLVSIYTAVLAPSWFLILSWVYKNRDLLGSV